MQFALLGNHPDGLELAVSLAAAGHRLIAYSGPAAGAEMLRRHGLTVTPVGDLEEVLADPAVGTVIVASTIANRPEQLRRALQSERHVLCIYPPDLSPDSAYEAAMIQADTRVALLPVMPETLHPGVARLAELAGASEGPLGTLRLVELERWSAGEVWLDAGPEGYRPALPGWDVLRALGGEISEVSALGPGEELQPGGPVLLSGRFERGGLFQVSLLPNQYEVRWRLAVVGSRGRAELVFPDGWPGPARLTWPEGGAVREEHYGPWNPWSPLIQLLESTERAARASGAEQDVPTKTLLSPGSVPRAALTWQDAVRGLELDDAARRSVSRRRTHTLEYPEATEETGFKGTMTLLGCGLLWIALLLLILSAWVPWLGLVIVPALLLFLLLQLLRWVVPGKRDQGG